MHGEPDLGLDDPQPNGADPAPAKAPGTARWILRTLILGAILGVAMFAAYLLAVAVTAPEHV